MIAMLQKRRDALAAIAAGLLYSLFWFALAAGAMMIARHGLVYGPWWYGLMTLPGLGWCVNGFGYLALILRAIAAIRRADKTLGDHEQH